MPVPFYGPIQRHPNRRSFLLSPQYARSAYGAVRAAHHYARQQNLYQRAYEGLSKWARSQKSVKNKSNLRYKYTKPAAMDKWGTPMMRNTIRPLRSKFPSNTRRVRYMGKGKNRKAMVKIPKVLTTHPHTVRQTVYLAKNSLDATTKSITSLQPFELFPSSTQQYLTACVFDLTKTWWGTTTIDGTNKARIGNQVVPPIYSDLYLTGSNNTLSLEKRCTMLTINNLPEQPNGLIPNNHYVSGFNLQLDIQTLAPGSQLVSIQVVRRSFQQDPVANGTISSADFQEMANDIKVVDKDKFQTIYQKMIHIPGLTPGQTIKHYKVKKYIKCMLKRNTLRKTSSISSFNTVVGGQIKPHYEFSSNGEMYNQCFLIIKAKRYNNTANVTSRKTASGGGTPGSSNLPDKWDEMTPAKCVLGGASAGATITFGGYTEPQLNTTGDTGILAGACIKIRGTVSSYFRVREILNQDVDNTADATPSEEWPAENLESINTITEYVSDDEIAEHNHSDDDEHTHPVPLDQPVEFDNENGPHIDTAGPEPVNSETDEEPEFIPNPKHNKNSN